MAKLSRPITVWFSCNKVSNRLEPINPATPVISHLRGCSLSCSFICWYFGIVCFGGALVFVDPRLRGDPVALWG